MLCEKGCCAYRSIFKRIQTRFTRSRKRFRVDHDKFIGGEYSPLLGESKSKEERSNPSTPRGATQLETQGTYGIPHSSNPPLAFPPPHKPTPPPPPTKSSGWTGHWSL